MAKKKVKCPLCNGKMIKLRNIDQRQCKDCGHREELLPVADQVEAKPIPKAKRTKKELTTQSKDPADNIPKDWIGDFQREIIKDPPTPMEKGPTAAELEAAHIARIRAKPTPGDVISPGLMQHPRVTVYCWPMGPGRGFRYGTRCPYPNPSWKKEVSGVQAFQFLKKVKSASRLNKLESGRIIVLN